MKIDVKEATVESSMTFGKSVDMGIAQSGVIHLMSLLTNLYNDPELAVIREYYTNALDAHIRVGQTKPVDIFLPTRDNPLFVVKDYGVGMSTDDIEFIYSQYGESTKRDTNDEAGAFGLGCKSALAIATQFTLTSIKDGIKTTALISKTETGINKVDILKPKAVEDENGTTITIPVPDVYVFNDKVSKFFKYSDSTKVKINGRHPESHLDSAIELETTLSNVRVLTKDKGLYSYGSPEYKVIMGNVPYDLPASNVEDSLKRQATFFDINMSKLDVLFVVGIGDVDLTPSREGLRYTDKTKDCVDRIIGAYVAAIRKKAQEEIDATDNRNEVFDVVTKWSRIYDRKTVTWRGEIVPSRVKFDTKEFKSVWRSGGDSTHDKTAAIEMGRKYVIVYGRNPEEYRKVSSYLTPYMESEGLGTRTFLFTDEIKTITNKWVTENDDIDFIHADKLVEIGKAQRKADREASKAALGAPVKFRYPVMTLSTGVVENVPYDLIEDNIPYLHVDSFASSVGDFFLGYFTGKRAVDAYYDRNRRAQIGAALAHFTSSDKVVLIGGNRKLSALQTRLKTSYNILEDFDKTIRGTFQVVHQRVKDIESIRGTSFETLFKKVKAAGLDTTIEDRELRRLINPTKKARQTHAKLAEYEKHLTVVAPNNRHVPRAKKSSAVEDILAKYTLLSHMEINRLSTEGMEHLIKYLNAVHSEDLTATP